MRKIRRLLRVSCNVNERRTSPNTQPDKPCFGGQAMELLIQIPDVIVLAVYWTPVQRYYNHE